jgi:hypothetical protein
MNNALAAMVFSAASISQTGLSVRSRIYGQGVVTVTLQMFRFTG